MATKVSEKLCFAWIGDFESLKNFVKEKLKLDGTWLQPGGDKKLFTSEDSTITWRKNKNLLSLDGERANDIAKELCKQMCKCDEVGLETPILDAGQSSVQSSDVCEAFESLKLGQSVNSEAIQALSGTIYHLTSVIAQFQSFMDKNQKDLDHGDETRAEQTNIADDVFEYGNQENICNANKAKSDIPIVLNEFTNPIADNGINLNNVNSGCESDNNLTSTEQISMEGHQVTYANVVASYSDLNNRKHNEKSETNNKSEHISQNSQSKANESPSDPEEFIGVERKRRKTKKFLLTGIAENVKQNQILSYLERRNIIPTYISVFPSRRRGTLSCKIHVHSTVSSLVEEDKFWPKFVSCKPWRPKDNSRNIKNTAERKINLTQGGNFSKYV